MAAGTQVDRNPVGQAKITRACTFTAGDGTGDDEEQVATVASKEQCESYILANHPTANGATWSLTDNRCYAEYGMSGQSQDALYVTCLLVKGSQTQEQTADETGDRNPADSPSTAAAQQPNKPKKSPNPHTAMDSSSNADRNVAGTSMANKPKKSPKAHAAAHSTGNTDRNAAGTSIANAPKKGKKGALADVGSGSFRATGAHGSVSPVGFGKKGKKGQQGEGGANRDVGVIPGANNKDATGIVSSQSETDRAPGNADTSQSAVNNGNSGATAKAVPTTAAPQTTKAARVVETTPQAATTAVPVPTGAGPCGVRHKATGARSKSRCQTAEPYATICEWKPTADFPDGDCVLKEATADQPTTAAKPNTAVDSTAQPTAAATNAPTNAPTPAPTHAPTNAPTNAPTTAAAITPKATDPQRLATTSDALLIQTTTTNAPTTTVTTSLNLLQKAATSPSRFSTFLGAIETAELEGMLSSNGPFTVFTPTNEAFAKLDNLDQIFKDQKYLRSVMLLHTFIGQAIFSGTLTDGMIVSTTSGDVKFNKMKQGWKVRAPGSKANLIEADVVSNNGVTHVLDGVLLPRTTTTTATTVTTTTTCPHPLYRFHKPIVHGQSNPYVSCVYAVTI